ncbi:MAG: S8 family serine peptidase [Akkermansiaceae bacterium]|nr:S8 family serine peptidase [Akkermansiaceae bacterium]MDP4645684.1 S8 family serine peptidase [Akkermansiaceae bacterium]MDP4778792.1 S8 family serine peptidase [Akkermansiaceae bacterium]MDP4847006.1 S8 family serine peptidase [Akkermansiaceae bacterium]MDP4996990.1 S8 family serine peptidase [Akkermansiaceae bacterium]
MHGGAGDVASKPDSASVSPVSAPLVKDAADQPAGDEVEAVIEKKERDESKLEYRNTEDGTVLKVSLNKAALRDADGKDEIVRLDPPATVETLSERLAELDAPKGVMPVVYQDGEQNNDPQPRFVTSDIFAKLPQEQAELLAKKHGLIIKDRPSYAPEYVIFSADQPLEALAKIEGIRDENFVETADVLLTENVVKRALPNDTHIARQWHLKASGAAVAGSDMNVEDAWKYGETGGVKGTGIGISIVDDGMQTNHPDLTTNANTDFDYDWNGDDNDPSPGAGDSHGTACAGVAAARGNNNLGVSGVAPEATLYGLRLIAGGFTATDVAEALTHEPTRIDISSNSWGPSDSGTFLGGASAAAKAALKTAAENGRGGKGTIFTWAGGNGGDNGDNSNYDSYANSIYTIAVGATSSSGLRSFYSEPGANVVICAPSNGGTLGITTTDVTGSNGYSTATSVLGADYTTTFGGTSSACPAVAGAIALMLEKNPELGWRDVQEILIRSANKINPTNGDWIVNGAGFNFNHDFGAGLIDVTAAVDMAATWTNLETQISTVRTQNSIGASIPNNTVNGVVREFDLSASNIRIEQVTLKVDITHVNRGDLAISLISPNGTESRLSEVHSDPNNNYSDWTFSSVRNWGENSRGTWTVKVADRSAANNAVGTLNSLELTVFGASDAPTNPAPQLVITSPADGALFSPNVPVTLTATATDLDIDGNDSPITNVQFFVNGIPFGPPDFFAPYAIQITPPLGNVSIVAKSTDPDGKTGESLPVSIFVANQVPVVEAFTVNYGAQAFADQQVSVLTVETSDPEGDDVTVSYQWRFSTDLITYVDESGATSANLPISPDNAGKAWVCEIRAKDTSNNTSAPTVTSPVNILTRPPLSIEPGSEFTYASGLVLNGSDKEITRPAIIHEFSQGSVGTQAAWVEILVMQDSDLSNWSLSDPEGNALLFLEDEVWENIPAGTLIVIFNGGAARDPLVEAPNFDASSGKIIVASTNRSYFSSNGADWPNFGNTGDSIFLLDASEGLIHSIAYGNSTATTPNVGNVPVLEATYYAGQEDIDADEANNWVLTTATNKRSVPTSDSSARVQLPLGTYTEDFNTIPGADGRDYPDGWTSYNQLTTSTTKTTEFPTMRLGTIDSFVAGNYNFGSQIGLLGSSSGSVFDPSYITLTLENTRRLSDLKISYDIIKVKRGGRSISFKLQYTTSPPGNTASIWTDVPGGAYDSGTLDSGTVTSFSNISLPAGFNNLETPIYLRWFYKSSGTSGLRDALAIDNVSITSAQVGSIFLNLTFQPDTVLENAGATSAVGTVTAHTPVTTDTLIQLTSSNTGLVTVPASILMRAGQSVVKFPIGVIDNAAVDGTRSVSISVAATGLVGDNQTFKVADDEGLPAGVTPGFPNGGVNDVFVSQLRSGVLKNPPTFSLAPGSVLPDGLFLSSATGIISGTVALDATPGPYPITIQLTNILGDVTTQSFVLNVGSGPPPFPEWIAGIMLSDETATGDPDFDLFPNFLEYAMGTLPDTIEIPSPVIFVREGDEISITYPEAIGLVGVVIIVEWSPSMEDGTWSTEDITKVEVPALSNEFQTVMKASLPIDPLEPKRFMRLRATEVPES